ncbi:MAG TPA: TAXI family TRAP transporter solute-binding subunit [Stellaceae bacterium]|nr:TAXI family TRAP transporter solute-binding subunit [Stellaceae bacterium]
MIRIRALAMSCCIALSFAAGNVAAKDRTGAIVIRAGKTDNPTHALARQFAGAVAVNGAYTLDVQESQGSVQNVIDALTAPRDFIFAASSDLIAAARRGRKPFSPDRRYREIRALVPMPALTVQWVVRQDGDVKMLSDLAGRSFIAGPRGSVSERLTTAALQVMGIDRQVQMIDIVDPAAAAAALKAKQVSGFALAGAYPVPTLEALARAVPIRLLGLRQPALGQVLAADSSIAAEILPKGTYPGVDADVTTLAIPDGLYTTTRMPAATAYRITKAFWTQRAALIARHPPWQAVSFATLATLGVRLHAGALRYYREVGAKVPRALR